MKTKAKKSKPKIRGIKRIKKVKLDPDEVLQVKVPDGHTPVMAPLSEDGTAEIAPIPRKWWKIF